MRRALLVCAAITFAIACTDNITEPTPDRSPVPAGTASRAPTVAFATTTTEDGLSISTDKDDYQPGDVVHLTGYGWQAGDVLDIVLTDDPLTHDPHVWTVEVGTDGTFRDQTYVVDEGDLFVTFTLVATSRATGRSLTVVFTDNIVGAQVRLNNLTAVTVAPGETISLAVTARVSSANSQNSPVTWQSTGWVLLPSPATVTPSGKLSNCVDTPNVTGTSGNGTEATATFNIAAPITSGSYDLWLALSDQDGAGVTACGGGGQSTKSRFVGVVTVLVVDETRPTVTINQAIGQADPTNASPINYTVVFSETVTDFATGDVTLTGAGSTGATATVSGSGTTYNVAVAGMTTTGPVTAALVADVAHDAVGNGNDASNTATVVYDNVGPEVTIDKKSDQPDLTNRSPILFTVIFDKPVSDFGDEDVTLGGTANPITAEVSAGSDGMNFEVAVSGMTGDGTVTATIAADVAHDAAGNGNMAASSTDNEVTYDTTEPTVTINQAAGQVDPTNSSPINFTVVFSEPVSGFANNDITLGGTAVPTTAVVSTTDPDLKTYNVAVAGMTGDGTVTAAVKAGAADDEATNHSTASTSSDNTVTYDVTPPVVSCGAADGLWHPADVSVACTASDATAGLANAADANFNLTTSVAANTETNNASTGSKIIYDAAGNSSTAGPVAGNMVDKKAPVVSCGAADGLWHAADVSISCTATDGGSGVDPESDEAFSLITNVAVDTYTSSASTNSKPVADAVGNSTTAGPTGGNMVDKQKPVVALSCPATPVILGASASASWTATDGGSGVATGFAAGNLALNTASVGKKTATAAAGTSKDQVDNTSEEVSCDYYVAYNFGELMAPVDKPNTMNVSKAGQGIPLKWRLTDASGNPVLNFTGAGLNVAVSSLACSVSPALDQIEEYAGNSGLQNLGDGYYQFNWKTPASYANSCRQIGLNLGEGFTRGPLAYFTFKK